MTSSAGGCDGGAVAILDLDDLRTEVAEDLAGEGRGDAVAELDHHQIGERQSVLVLRWAHVCAFRSINTTSACRARAAPM